jgi:hypothetical protein
MGVTTMVRMYFKRHGSHTLTLMIKNGDLLRSESEILTSKTQEMTQLQLRRLHYRLEKAVWLSNKKNTSMYEVLTYSLAPRRRKITLLL